MVEDIRWQQRFDNYQRAFLLLREAVDCNLDTLNQLEKEGVIQRFEYTFELAWKTLKDKMEFDGIILDTISPKSVVRKAHESKYIHNISDWLKMIGDRNLMSHTYDIEQFEMVVISIQKRYLLILDEWYMSLLSELNNK